jgi:hypothetical protein
MTVQTSNMQRCYADHTTQTPLAAAAALGVHMCGTLHVLSMPYS